jgi:hypothetical protein
MVGAKVGADVGIEVGVVVVMYVGGGVVVEVGLKAKVGLNDF